MVYNVLRQVLLNTDYPRTQLSSCTCLKYERAAIHMCHTGLLARCGSQISSDSILINFFTLITYKEGVSCAADINCLGALCFGSEIKFVGRPATGWAIKLHILWVGHPRLCLKNCYLPDPGCNRNYI